MLKWSTIYAKIAADHESSDVYVRFIHTGKRACRSEKAKAILADLMKYDRAIKQFKKAVA